MDTTCQYDWENLLREILNTKCTDQHLSKIAEKIVTWEHLARRLGLTEAKIEEIKRNNENNYLEQKDQFLIKWKEKFGSKATYNVLLKHLEECEMREQAEELIAIIIKGQTFISVFSSSNSTRMHMHTHSVYRTHTHVTILRNF